MRWTPIRALMALTISLGFSLVMWSGLSSIRPVAGFKQTLEVAGAPLTSVLYRFNPAAQSFFTVPLPLGSTPLGVAVTGTNPTQVWVAESGRNRIGRVVFTSTVDYHLYEYPVTSTTNSRPFRIAVRGNEVWFTERGANRVGKLNVVTGLINEFYGHGLPANAGLADIQVAPNGAIWLAGQQSNSIIRLTINSVSDYMFQPYTNSLLIGPTDLAIESSDAIWFTAPAARRIGRLIPSVPNFTWPLVPSSTFSEPYEIVVQNGSSWTTDRNYNRLGAIAMDTLTLADFYGPVSRPAGIAVRNSNVFWITQQSSWGAVARFVFTSEISNTLKSFPLPVSELLPTGIDVAVDNSVWLAAYIPYRVYLPAVYKNAP